MGAAMNRRRFVRTLGAMGLSLSAGGCLQESRRCCPALPSRPNIVFFLIDDMGWPDLGCYGNDFAETPRIDRLAKQGMRFTNAYAAGAVCSPTRASIMAGQYPARVGITDFIPGHYRPFEKMIVAENELQLPLESVTIADALKANGYSTGYIGKWHLGSGQEFAPDKQGFDWTFLSGKNRNDKQVTAFTDAAVQFLDENEDRPFFLFLSHHTVHIPLEAPAELVKKYEDKPKPATGVNNPVYAAMIEHLDSSTGRILDKLDELGLTEKTIVIFFSDNGGLRQRYDGKGEIVSTNAPLRDEKGTLYEGGIREPLIVRWPGVVQAGTTCDEPVTSVDFYPTLLQVADAKPDPTHVLDGVSLVPLLRGRGRLGRDAIYWHYPHYHHSTPAGAIRQGHWKLLEFFEDGKVELYNLAEDLSEKDDLAGRMPQRAERMRATLAKWRQSVGARMPTLNPQYDPDRAHEWHPRPRKK